MSKEEIKEEFKSYTKEQIIDALAGALCNRNCYESIIFNIKNRIEDNIFKKEMRLIDASNEKWKQASQDKTKYLKSLVNKYGTTINFGKLTPAEFNKYIQLENAERTAWKELNKLQDKQGKRLKNNINY